MSHESPRRIVIGDVHGHYQGLEQLLTLLNFSAQDQIYFLGDLIDRGPQSARVVELVRTHQYPCLLGNHEQMMCYAYSTADTEHFAMDAWLSAGGRTTLNSYKGKDEQLEIDLAWMATLPSFFDLGDLWLVHAGLHPNMPLEKQSSQQFCWIRQEFHQMLTPFFSDKLIVTGHTITFTFPGVEPGQLAQGIGWLDIDTGAYHPRSGWMTALDYTQNAVYQVNVFNGSERVRPLSIAVTPIQPWAERETRASKFISRIA
ncbi:MAG TPA: metallophosphoesterase family protein [Stenomitos sp.]